MIREILGNRYLKAFSLPLSKDSKLSESLILKYIKHFYQRTFNITESVFISKYYNSPHTKGTIYLIEDGQVYKPLSTDEVSSYSDSTFVSIKTIREYFTKITNEDNFTDEDSNKIKLICFLLSDPLTEDEEKVVFRKRKYVSPEDKFKKYLRRTNTSLNREDALAKIIDILHDKSIKKVTFITNDLNFTLSIITSLIAFILRDGEFCLMYDPGSMFDLVSFRLMLLQRIGVIVKVLPIKNKFPHYCFIPNWLPTDSDTSHVEYIINFKTYFFDSNRENRNYYIKIDDERVIEENLARILRYDNIKSTRNNYSLGSKELKKYKLKIEPIEDAEYLHFLESSFKKAYEDKKFSLDKIYVNAEFSFETIDVDKIYRRSNSFTKYKVFQACNCIDDLNGLIYRTSNNGKTIECIPANIYLRKGLLFPINCPILEYNERYNRYEIAEGHSRIWSFIHKNKVTKIKTVVVKNISNKFLKNDDDTVQENIKHNNDWERAFDLTEIEDKHIENMLVSPRMIEQITHKIPKEIIGDFLSELFNELVSHNILSEDDKEFNNYLN